MPKNIFTERDIEDLARRGSTSLALDDDTLITDLAYEKAQQLGISLVKASATPPCAPVRPYLSAIPRVNPPAAATSFTDAALAVVANAATATPPVNPNSSKAEADIQNRLQTAVMARLGDQIEPATLEKIIQRVLKRVSLS